MQIAASIFKAYDIRGIVPSTVTADVAEGIGKAFGTIALAQGETTVAVGRDGRLSGPDLSAALMRGLAAVGIEVIDVGSSKNAQDPAGLAVLCMGDCRKRNGAGTGEQTRDHQPGKFVCHGQCSLRASILTMRSFSACPVIDNKARKPCQ